MCEWTQMPGIKFGSSSDVSAPELGLVCSRLETPLPGSGPTSWATWYKLARLIEGIP